VLHIIYNLLDSLLGLMVWALILAAVVSWLISFNILDSRNRFVWSVADFLNRVTDWLLRPIRSRIRPVNGIDLSPLIALLAIQLLVRPLLAWFFQGLATGIWEW
jgi:YggT family protein